jgi:hypothetical protein
MDNTGTSNMSKAMGSLIRKKTIIEETKQEAIDDGDDQVEITEIELI